tara:strand:- start:322 stop:1014 length:693 start_codon:yes stop_codon:yes gene_type:complete
MKITINSKQLLQELESFNLKYKKVAQKYNEGVEAHNILVKEQKVRIDKAYQEWVAPIKEEVKSKGLTNIVLDCLDIKRTHSWFRGTKIDRVDFNLTKCEELYPHLHFISNGFSIQDKHLLSYLGCCDWNDHLELHRLAFPVRVYIKKGGFDAEEILLRSKALTDTELHQVKNLSDTLKQLKINTDVILEGKELRVLALVRKHHDNVEKYFNGINEVVLPLTGNRNVVEWY